MVSPLWRWRSWVLVLLLVGPVLAYVGLGMLWLWERGWVACTVAAVLWLLAGGRFLDPGRALDQDGTPAPAPARLGFAPTLLAARPRGLEARAGRGREGRNPVVRRSARERHLHRHRAAVYSGASPATIIRSPPSRSTMFRWSS